MYCSIPRVAFLEPASGASRKSFDTFQIAPISIIPKLARASHDKWRGAAPIFDLCSPRGLAGTGTGSRRCLHGPVTRGLLYNVSVVSDSPGTNDQWPQLLPITTNKFYDSFLSVAWIVWRVLRLEQLLSSFILFLSIPLVGLTAKCCSHTHAATESLATIILCFGIREADCSIHVTE